MVVIFSTTNHQLSVFSLNLLPWLQAEDLNDNQVLSRGNYMEKQEEYQISSSVHEEILEIVVTGIETSSNSERMKNDIDNVIIKNNVKNVITDVRALKGRLGVTDTYQRVRSYHLDIRKFNLTVVDLFENAEYQNFHEATSQNAGLRFKWFTDMDAARDWLKNKQKSDKKNQFHLP
jgi:hypothetical protein